LKTGDETRAGLRVAGRASPSPEAWRGAGKRELEFSERRVGVEEVFGGSPAMEVKSHFPSRKRFRSAVGLCVEPGVAWCVPQVLPPPAKGCCCAWEETGPRLVEHVTAVPRDGVKTN